MHSAPWNVSVDNLSIAPSSAQVFCSWIKLIRNCVLLSPTVPGYKEVCGTAEKVCKEGEYIGIVTLKLEARNSCCGTQGLKENHCIRCHHGHCSVKWLHRTGRANNSLPHFGIERAAVYWNLVEQFFLVRVTCCWILTHFHSAHSSIWSQFIGVH